MDLEPAASNQYLRVSIVELLTKMNDKIETLDGKVDNLTVQFAVLPTSFITRTEMDAQRTESREAKRWAIGATVSSLGVVVTGLFLFL